MANIKKQDVYGLSQAIINEMSAPIVSRRNPTVNDRAPVGQMWVNRTANTAYILTNITANQSIWTQQSSTVGDLTVGGTITAGTGITATTGDVTATHGDVVVSTATHGITLPGLVS